uniref:OSJNBb0067G11.6 protein n=1 Tax=Oryza sativa subsp. japonica TaxID=39947 RepID=Q7X719_ORYSJ|nr:OSJNBb0067G11.6 [Oryza sativa Japonica Group]
MQIAELEEWREKVYHNAKIYKERTKPGDKVLMFNSRVKLFGHGKLRSKWEGLFDVIDTSSHGAITLRDESDDGKAAPPPAERYVGTLFTKVGDEVLHKYTTPTDTPSTPKGELFRIQGVRTPPQKGLLRPLMASEKEGAAESRSPPPMKVKRHLMPRPIVRAPGQFQEDKVLNKCGGDILASDVHIL